MTRPLRIGVLGLTHDHVWRNIEELHDVQDAVLVAVADPNRPLLEQAKKRFNCPTYRDYEQMLQREQLDCAWLFADNATCVELGELAASRKLHLMVEKPLAASLEGADRLLAAARYHDVRLMVNWPFAWWPPLSHALSMARQGAIGMVWQVKYRAAHQGPRELGCSDYFCDWLYNRELNGAGAAIDYGCYGALLACHLLGLPSRVTCVAGRLCKEDIPVDDNAMILMTYARALAVAEASWSQVGNLTSYGTALYGTGGTLLVQPKVDGRLLLATEQHPDGQPVEVPPLPAEQRSASANFVHAIHRGEPFAPLCHDRTARDVQEVLEAALISAESGSDVTLPLRVY